jgi:hypothetical protein
VSFLEPVKDKMRVETGSLLMFDNIVVVRVSEAVLLVNDRVKFIGAESFLCGLLA